LPFPIFHLKETNESCNYLLVPISLYMYSINTENRTIYICCSFNWKTEAQGNFL
jgi:hypothetical protein